MGGRVEEARKVHPKVVNTRARVDAERLPLVRVKILTKRELS